MATYCYTNESYGIPERGPHRAAFMRHISIPDLISGQPLALSSAPTVTTTFPSTGFASADILQVFKVPAGFCLRHVGVRVSTVEGGAATMDIGCSSATQTHLLAADADGFCNTASAIDLNTAASQITLVADGQLGPDTYTGVLYITNGTIDITFNTAATAVAVFDVWAHGYMAW